jgi:sugar lactone lactonase YvrE
MGQNLMSARVSFMAGFVRTLGTVALLALLLALPARADLLITDGDNVQRFNSQTGALINATFVSLPSATGLAMGQDGNLYVGTSNPGEVFRYNASTGAPIDKNPDQSAKPFVFYEGTPPTPDPHDVSNPAGMKFGPDGRLYIADVTNSNVHIYTSTGNSAGSITGNNFSQPVDVAFDSAGNLYAANGNGVGRSVAGAPFQTFVQGQTGSINVPVALLFAPDTNLYVLDEQSSQIFRFKADGSANGTFSLPNTFDPAYMALGPDGKLYIDGLDFNTGSGEVLRYLTTGAADGTFISGGLTSPTYMTFDVPEPAAVALVMIGGLAALMKRGRRG